MSLHSLNIVHAPCLDMRTTIAFSVRKIREVKGHQQNQNYIFFFLQGTLFLRSQNRVSDRLGVLVLHGQSVCQ